MYFKMCNNFFCLFMLVLLSKCFSLKILIYVPGASDSHIHFNYKFADMLHSAGHNVTILTMIMPFGSKISPPKPPRNVDEIRYVPNFLKNSKIENFNERVFEPLQISQMMHLIRIYTEISTKLCYELANDKTLLETLSEKHFDLAFAHFVTLCPVGLTEKLKIPKFIWVIPGTFIMESAVEILHLPNTASYIPYYTSDCSDRMNFVERTTNLITELVFATLNVLLTSLTDKETEAFRQYPNENFPHLYNLAENSVQGLLINGEEFLDFPRPLFSNVIHMGDLKMTGKSKQLNEEWQNFMDESQDGVIMFSLGTIANTSLMPTELKKAFLRAFAKFPRYSVIWRLEGELPQGIYEQKHIKITHWIPQVDLLHHPKCKLFITHGGYNSLLETVQAGVPMVLIPLFADQYGNAKRAVRHELGVILNKMEHDPEKITKIIQEVLFDEKYTNNAKKFASLLQDKIVPTENITLHMIDKIVRSKKWPLVKAPKKLNYLQYYCIDIVCFYFVLFSLVLYLIYKAIRKVF